MEKDEAISRLLALKMSNTVIARDDIVSLVEKIYEDFEKMIPKQQTIKVHAPLNGTLVSMMDNYKNVNIDAFSEWMAYKKYKNKGAITKTLNMLNKYDFQTQQEMVNKSIMNEYKGLFEPKKQRNRTDNNVDVAMGWIEENDTQDLQAIGG